jgi:hypothetical protein
MNETGGDRGGRRMPQRESDLVRWVIGRLRELGHARKIHGSVYQDAGEPDVDACIDGRAVKIEVKMPGATPTGVQVGALRRWQRAGALAGWVTSMRELEALVGHVNDYGWVNPQVCRHKTDGGDVCERCGASL